MGIEFKVRSLGLALAGLLIVGTSAQSQETVDPNCKPEHTFSTLKPGILSTVSHEYPPFASFVSGEPSGVDIEIMQRFAKRQCLQLDIDPKPGPAAIESVISERADLSMGDHWRTRKRAAVLTLSDPVYADIPALVSKDGISKVEQLKGKTVGVIQGHFVIKPLEAYLNGDGTVKIYPTQPAAYTDLINGRIDVWLDTYGSVATAMKARPSDAQVKRLEPDAALDFSLNPGQSVYAVMKGNTDLAGALSAVVASLRASGELGDILEKYGIDRSAAEPGEPRFAD